MLCVMSIITNLERLHFEITESAIGGFVELILLQISKLFRYRFERDVEVGLDVIIKSWIPLSLRSLNLPAFFTQLIFNIIVVLAISGISWICHVDSPSFLWHLIYPIRSSCTPYFIIPVLNRFGDPLYLSCCRSILLVLLHDQGPLRLLWGYHILIVFYRSSIILRVILCVNQIVLSISWPLWTVYSADAGIQSCPVAGVLLTILRGMAACDISRIWNLRGSLILWCE